MACLGQYGDAYAAFDKVFDSRGVLQGGAARLYHFWATLALAQGLDAMLANDIRVFEQAGLKYIDVLEKAGQYGMGEVVEEALTQFEAGLKKKRELKTFAEVEVFIRLMKIKDSFEAWRALGKEVSNQWPKGHSVVKAVREIRR